MILSLENICRKVKLLQRSGKKIGLITGCFDVLHMGHINLFHYAKKKVDFLVIGVDSDFTVSLVKGKSRPINNIKNRLKHLSELRSVDFVFEIKDRVNYKDANRAEIVYSKLLQKIMPNYLITSKSSDRYWKQKKLRAKKFSVKLLLSDQTESDSSTTIINKLLVQ